VKQIQLLIAAP